MSLLSGRLADLIFAGFFSAFVCISVLVEIPVCLGARVAPDSPHAALRLSYDWCLQADRIFIVQPLWSRIAVCLHCFGFAIFYALFALGFLFRWNWIQRPALMVGAAKLYAGALYMLANLLDEKNAPPKPALFIAQSFSYMAVPFLLIIRMWNPKPFGSKKQHAT